MYVEITTTVNPKKFSLQDLTIDELELIHRSLVTLKDHSLQDAEAFKEPRKLVVAMFQKIDEELVNARS